MSEEQKRIFALIRAIIEGYEAQKKLYSHECPKCLAGAQLLIDGNLNHANFQNNICPESLECIKKIIQADLVIKAFNRLQAKLDDSTRYGSKPTDELGIEHLYE